MRSKLKSTLTIKYVFFALKISLEIISDLEFPQKTAPQSVLRQVFAIVSEQIQVEIFVSGSFLCFISLEKQRKEKQWFTEARKHWYFNIDQ
jgi:hypothetical protein